MFIWIRAMMWVFITWRWGDWRNWKAYQPSILFFILGDTLYNFLCCNYSMWQYAPTTFLPSHTAVALFIALINYPCAVILYLGHYPSQKVRQILWIVLWVLLWALVEWADKRLGLLSYYHGWSIWWSLLFMSVTVPMIRLHHRKPLWAYGLSTIFIIFLLTYFHVPINK